jgi:pyruvate dehydrogenase E1 component alpha subunit
MLVNVFLNGQKRIGWRNMGNLLDLNFQLYKKLYQVRKSEEFIIKIYDENEMKCPMHMSLGQEFIPVGVLHALTKEDIVFATYRSHAVYIAKTGETDIFFAELYGKKTGIAEGKAGSMHLSALEHGFMGSSAIVASAIPVAIGAAFANKYRKDGHVVAVFFGDGACDEGAFWESLNVACVMKLPVLFVCEDNGYAVNTPKHLRQGYHSIINTVSTFECMVFESATTDVEDIYCLAQNAIESIKRLGKPAFIRAECYRYLAHVGIHEDFDEGYRPESEFRQWHEKDCLAIQRQKLLVDGLQENVIQEAERFILESIEQSIFKAKEAPFCDDSQCLVGVFHENDNF